MTPRHAAPRAPLEAAPDSVEALSAALRDANLARLAVQPRGGGTKLGWCDPPRRVDLIVSLGGLTRVLEHAWADMTVQVEAGCTIASLQRQLAQHGQRLALDPLWPEQATIGGVLSANDSGSWRLRYGSARDLLIGVTLVRADGTVASSGGKVVKNVAGYDLPKLTIGAFGTLGVVAHAIFRVHPLPEHSRSFAVNFSQRSAMQSFVMAVLDAKLCLTALQIRAATGPGCHVEVLLEGTVAGVASQVSSLEALCAGAQLQEAAAEVWQARRELWQRAGAADVIVKLSVLPSQLEASLAALSRAAVGGEVEAVLTGSGLGHARLTSDRARLAALRTELAAHGGTLSVLRRPTGLDGLDTWGDVPAVGLMRALKHRFDPLGTLNPGCFVGGI